jgi:hypothetical protein
MTYEIRINGDRNDSNLVIESAHGSITEHESVPAELVNDVSYTKR